MADNNNYPLQLSFRQDGGKHKINYSLQCEEGTVELKTDVDWITITPSDPEKITKDGLTYIVGSFTILAASTTERRTAILNFVVNDGDTCFDSGKYIEAEQTGPEHICVCSDLHVTGKTDIQYNAGENIIVGEYSSDNDCVVVTNVVATSSDNWLTITSFTGGLIKGTITRNDDVQRTRNASLSITGRTTNSTTDNCYDYDLITVTQKKKDVTCTCENNFRVHPYTVDSNGGNGIQIGYIENINSCITGIDAYKISSTDSWINRVGMSGIYITGDVESYETVTDTPRRTSIGVSGKSENGDCIVPTEISQNGKGYTCDECKDFELYDQMTEPISSDGILNTVVIAKFSHSDNACKNWSGTLFETDKNGNTKQGGYTSTLSISTIDSTHRSIKVANGIPANQDRNAKYYSFKVYDGTTQCTTGSGVRLIVQEGDVRCECEDLIDKDGSMVRTLNKTFDFSRHTSVMFASGDTAGCGRLEMYAGSGDEEMIENLDFYHPDGDEEKYIWTGNVTTADEQRSITLNFYYYDIEGRQNPCSEGITVRQLPYVCDCPDTNPIPYLTPKTDIPGDENTKYYLWDFAFEPGGASDNLCMFVIAEATNTSGSHIDGYTAYTKFDSSSNHMYVSIDTHQTRVGVEQLFKIKLYPVVNSSKAFEADTWYDASYLSDSVYDKCDSTTRIADCMQKGYVKCDCNTHNLKFNNLKAIAEDPIIIVSDRATIPNDEQYYTLNYDIRDCAVIKGNKFEIYIGSTLVDNSVASGRSTSVGGSGLWFSSNDEGGTRVFTVKVPVYLTDNTPCQDKKILTITQKGCDCESFVDGDIFSPMKFIGADETTYTATAYLNCLPEDMTFEYDIYEYDENASCSDTGCECFNEKCYRKTTPQWYNGGSITPDTSGNNTKLILTLNVDANDGQYTDPDGRRRFYVGIIAKIDGEEEPCYKSISQFIQNPTCNVCETILGDVRTKNGEGWYKKIYPTAGIINDEFAYAATVTCLLLEDYAYEAEITIYDDSTDTWVIDNTCSLRIDDAQTTPKFMVTVPANQTDYVKERRVYIYIKNVETGERVSVNGEVCSTWLSMLQTTAADCSCNSYGGTKVRFTEAEGLSKDSEGYILTTFEGHGTRGLVIGTCNMDIINTDCLRYHTKVTGEYEDDLDVRVGSDGTITIYPQHENQHGSQGEKYSLDINIYKGNEYCENISGQLIRIKLVSL